MGTSVLDNSDLERRLLDENQKTSNRIDLIEQKINLILDKLDSVGKGTDKMTSHIDFINDVYYRVQTPLYWICDRISLIRGHNQAYIEKQIVKNTETETDINSQD